jgi:hypothetical protein
MLSIKDSKKNRRKNKKDPIVNNSDIRLNTLKMPRRVLDQ